MEALHFGAGNIGRGLIGSVLSDSGINITFVDTEEDIIEQINEDGGYIVEMMDGRGSQQFISGVEALNSLKDEQAIIEGFPEYDLVTTSVGANNLDKIAPIIKAGLLECSKNDTQLTVLANENMINATDVLQGEIKEICNEVEWNNIVSSTFFLNTAIDRQSMHRMSGDKNVAMAEPYYEWVIECKDEEKTLPGLKGVLLVDDLQPYLERKLYIVNAGHAAFAYFGYLFGYETIQQAGKDDLIFEFIHKYLQETAGYFTEEYDMAYKDMNEFIINTIKRHTNDNLKDPIHRVAKDPKRKLNVQDRLVAPMLNLETLGMDHKKAKVVVAAAYLYQCDEDLESLYIQDMIRDEGLEKTIQEVSEIPDELSTQIAEIARNLKKDPISYTKTAL